MELIDRLDKKELIELLGKCWMTHDGMWFYNCFEEFGIEKANKVNKAAMETLAPIEIKRYLEILGIEKIETFEDFKYFFSNVAELLMPDFMNIIMSFPEKNIMHWEFNEKNCWAYNGIKMLGVIDQYECGPLYRIGCWLNILKIKYDITPQIDKCVIPAKDSCSGDMLLYLQ